MTLGERIIYYRAKNRLSQKDFAELCGVTPQTIYAIENGYQKASKTTVIKINLVLDGDNNEFEHQ